MAHDLEIRSDNTAAFLSVREIPWHQLGIVAGDDIDSIEKATLVAQMRYKFSLEPVYVSVPSGMLGVDKFIGVVGDKQAVVRENIDTAEIKAFGGGLSGKYIVHSLEDAWAWVNGLLPHGAKLETIGNLRDGAVAFLCVKLPVSALAGTPDQVDMYLTVRTSYDGSSATSAIISPVRVVCANTMAWAMKEATKTVKVRHNTDLVASDKVKAVLGLAEEKVAQVDALKGKLSFSFSGNDMQELVTDLFPIREGILETVLMRGYDSLSTGDKRVFTSMGNARDKVFDLWRFSPYAATGGDGWSAYQAVVEYADHFASVKGDASLRRAEKQLEQENSELKLKALELMGVGL